MNLQLAMLNTPEIILILVFALVFFGAKNLPEMARGLGQGIREFRKAAQETADEFVREPGGASASFPPAVQPPTPSPTPPAPAAPAARKG